MSQWDRPDSSAKNIFLAKNALYIQAVYLNSSIQSNDFLLNSEIFILQTSKQLKAEPLWLNNLNGYHPSMFWCELLLKFSWNAKPSCKENWLGGEKERKQLSSKRFEKFHREIEITV